MKAMESGAGTSGAAAAGQIGVVEDKALVVRVPPEEMSVVFKDLDVFGTCILGDLTIRITTENIDQFVTRVGEYYAHVDDQSRVKEIPNTPSLVDQPKIKLKFKKNLAEAELSKMASLLQNYPEFSAKVSKVNFEDNSSLSNDVLARIVKQTRNIKVLNLSWTNITELPDIRLPNLTSLDVCSYNVLAGPALAKFVMQCADTLEALYLRSPNIPDLLAVTSPKLTKLKECTVLDPDDDTDWCAIEDFERAYPGLRGLCI